MTGTDTATDISADDLLAAGAALASDEANFVLIPEIDFPLDGFLEALREEGQPEEMLWLMRELFTVVFDGRNSKPASGVEEALGRPATDFSEYLRKVMATGAWDRSGMLQTA